MTIQKLFYQIVLMIALTTSLSAKDPGSQGQEGQTPKSYVEVRARLLQAFEIDNTTLRTVGATDAHINRVGLLNGEMLRTMDRLGPAYDRSKNKDEATKIMGQIEQVFVRRMNGIGRVLGPNLYKKFLNTTEELKAKLKAQSNRANQDQKQGPKANVAPEVLKYLEQENLAILQLKLSDAQLDKYGQLVRDELQNLQNGLSSESRAQVLKKRSHAISKILGPQKFKTFQAILFEIRRSPAK
jgi:hypothetical protein